MRTSFSRRELYALGEMLGDSVTCKEGGRIIYGGGGSGGGGRAAPTETTQTTYNTNIPEYAKPYVETMLQGTQKQLFQTAPNAETGATEITGFQPYKAYGGTYDAQGNQTSYDPGKAVAGFQPLQEAAQKGIAGMQMPGEFQQAGDVTRAGITAAMGNYYNPSQFGAQQVGTQDYTGSNVGQYMSPYMQNVVDIQQREAQRQGDIAGTQRAGQATRSGAFGGSRAAIMDAEAARNLATQKGDIQAAGQQAAFQNAQQQFNAQQQANLQAQTANQGAGLQAQQMGEQSRQYGAGYGMQNLQAGMQGAQQLAGLGQAGLASQQGIYNMQNTVGAQQQGLEQQKINQAMTDYANAQQYPLMQLGTMSNMLRGLPMQAQTTNQYAAAPNQTTQAIGTAGAAASLYNALKAKGGVIEEKRMASGGITDVMPRYDVGGEVYYDLMKMGPEELQAQIKNSSSEKVKEMAKSLLKQKQMAGGGIVAFGGGGETGEEKAGEAEAKVGMAERLAQTPNATASGILGAGILPQAPAQPAAPPPVAQAVQSATELTPVMKAIAAEQQTKSSRPLSAYTQEVQDEYKAAGVAERNPEERANLMAERVNAEDEARRKKSMRMAEFFASWGSTPGPTLVAGLQAFKEKVPMLINDMDKAKQVRMEINKSISALDEATRLEKKGYIDEGVKRRQKEADKMEALNLKVAEIQEQEAAAKRGEVRAEAASVRAGEREKAKDERYSALQREVTQMKIDSDMELKKIDAAWHLANQNQASNTNLLKIWEVAQGARGTAEAKIANIMRSPEYDKALRDANTEVTADSSPAVKKMQEDGKKALTELQNTFKTMRETADKTAEVMAKQLEAKGVNVPTANPKTGSTTPNEDKAALQWANDPKSFGWTQEKADKIKKELGAR